MQQNKQPNQRDTAIDAVRGIAIIAMVLAHTNAYFSGNPMAVLLWNLGLFAVHAFIICSALLFFNSAQGKVATYDFPYFKKRVLRLLVPYYMYLAAFFTIQWFFERKNLTLMSIVKNITLTTKEVNVNWLVVLFISFTFLMPLLEILYRKYRIGFYVYTAIALGISVLLLFMKSPIHFKLIMWLPWSLVIIATWYAQKQDATGNAFLRLSRIWFCVFLATFAYHSLAGHTLRFYDHKYPPDLYHLSYGIAITFALYVFCQSALFKQLRIQPVLDFMSRNSYSFFFLHFLVLNLFVKFFNPKVFGWPGFFMVILILSMGVQAVFEQVQRRYFTASPH